MAVLSSKNGKFYEVPDADLKKYELPADKVKQVLAEMDGPAGGPGVEPYGAGPAQVVIHVTGGAQVDGGPPEAEGRVEPYGYYGGGYGYGYPYYGYRRRRYYWGWGY